MGDSFIGERPQQARAAMQVEGAGMNMQVAVASDPRRIWTRSVAWWVVIGAVAWAVTAISLSVWIPPHGNDWLIDVLVGALLGIVAGPFSGLSAGLALITLRQKIAGSRLAVRRAAAAGTAAPSVSLLCLFMLVGMAQWVLLWAVLLALVTAGLGYLTGTRIFYGRRPSYAPAQPDGTCQPD
jgi:hypothetical protein